MVGIPGEPAAGPEMRGESPGLPFGEEGLAAFAHLPHPGLE